MDRESNVTFDYVYRDAGNYKNFGSIVLSNACDVDPADLAVRLKESLIDGQFFYASSARVPELFFENFPFSPELDVSWHEFENLRATSMPVSDTHRRDILELLCDLSKKQSLQPC